VLSAAGLTQASARELLDCAPRRLLDAQAALSAEGLGPMPVDDGMFIDPPRVRSAVPVLVGHTTHDWSFMIADSPWYSELMEDRLPEALALVAPLADPSSITRYRAMHPNESPQLLLARIATDLTFGLFAGRLAQERADSGSPVYRYEFAYPVREWPVPLGATHCGEVPFVFDTVEWARIAGDRPDRYSLAHEVSNAWLSFAESGVPRLPDGTPWPRFVKDTASTVLIDAPQWSRVTSMAPDPLV